MAAYLELKLDDVSKMQKAARFVADLPNAHEADKLSAEALSGVVEEYVTRDGTELTDATSKTEAVLRALDRGELVLVYDPESCTCNIVPVDQVTDSDPSEHTVELDDPIP